jgi:hypothetical protein
MISGNTRTIFVLPEIISMRAETIQARQKIIAPRANVSE